MPSGAAQWAWATSATCSCAASIDYNTLPNWAGAPAGIPGTNPAETATFTDTGALILSGANTYSGGTTLNLGNLVVGSDSALGTGTLTLNGGLLSAGGVRTVANPVIVGGNFAIGGAASTDIISLTGAVNLGGSNRTIEIAGQGGVVLSNVISDDSGGRTLTVNSLGVGTLTLSGANTFGAGGGGLTLNSAAFLAGNNSAFGVGTLTVTGGAIGAGVEGITVVNPVIVTGDFNMGGVAGTGLTLAGAVDLGANTLTHSGAGSGTLTGSVSGTAAGGITVTAGTLNLTGNMAGYSGTSAAAGGTLNLQGTGNYTGNSVVSVGTLNMNSAAAINYGSIGGTNAVTGGALNMSAPLATCLNDSTVTGGTLNLSAGSYKGGLTLGDNGIFNYTGGTFAPTGGADIRTTAGSTLTIASDLNFDIGGAGHTLTNGGTTVVNGTLTGNLTGNAGGLVEGSGTISGTLTNNGAVKPGNSIGTLTVSGDYYQGSRAKLQIEIASATSNDLLAISGSADLEGILETVWTGGYTPAIKTKFGTILTASSGITGQFSSLLTNITPTVLFKPKYDIPNRVYLMVERDYTNENLIPYLNTNQRSIGSMLNSVGNNATGDLDAVLSKLDALPAYSMTAYALDQVAAKGAEAQYGMSIAAAEFNSNNIADRLSDLRYGVYGISINGLSVRQGDITKPVMFASNASDIIPSGMNERWGLFIKGNVVVGNQKDTPDYLGYNFTTAGVTMGGDYRFTKSFIAGVMAGISNSQGDVDNNGSKVKINSYTFGIYGTYYKREFFIDGQINWGISNYDNTRRIVFPGLDRTATSRPDGNQFNAYAGIGQEFKIKKWVITPSMSLQYIGLDIDNYTEKGAGAINLDVDKQNMESLKGNMGARLSYAIQTGRALVIPSIRASYGYEFIGGSRNVTGQLAQGSSPFTIETASPDRSSLYLGAGINAITKNTLSLYINYGLLIGESRYTSHNINAGVRWGF